MRIVMMMAVAMMLFASCRTTKTAEKAVSEHRVELDSARIEEGMEVMIDEWYFYHDSLPPVVIKLPKSGGAETVSGGAIVGTRKAAVVRHMAVKRSATAEATARTEKAVSEEVTQKEEHRAGGICRVAMVAIVIAAIALMMLLKLKFQQKII
ncbi:MAG: hypothetical protein ACI4UN_03985 [Muribaculaceae bacterium]